MNLVTITALGVGGATVLGALIGFIFKNLSYKFSDVILSFAAGVMLAASILGLVLPSIEYGGKYGILIAVVGIFVGAVSLTIIDKIVGTDLEYHSETSVDKVLLFVIAIAIHNFPEGIAAGVGFGSGNVSHAFMIAGGIALQNIPEGMVIIAPMLAAGISPSKTFILATITGIVEILGTRVGFYAVSVANAILPFALAFAGGTMLYVVSDEMIPETHSHGVQRGATYALLLGFCFMLISDYYLG